MRYLVNHHKWEEQRAQREKDKKIWLLSHERTLLEDKHSLERECYQVKRQHLEERQKAELEQLRHQYGIAKELESFFFNLFYNQSLVILTGQ